MTAWPVNGTATLSTTTAPANGPRSTVVQQTSTTLWLAPAYGLVVRSALTGTVTTAQAGTTTTTAGHISQHLDIESLIPQ